MESLLELSPPLMVRNIGPPSESEGNQIKQIMTQQSSKLTQLSAEIIKARAALDKLLAEEAEARSTYEVCRSLLSPMRRLPLELLSAIFVWCLPDDAFIRPARRQAPLLLTQISASWRTVALSTPQLWSTLNVVCNLKSRGSTRLKEVDRIIAPSMNLWLSRTDNLPLSISIDGLPMKQSIIQILFQHSTRCRHLVLKRIQAWAYLQVPDRQFPLLKSLYVHSLVRQIRQLSSAFASAPQLDEIYWEDAGSHLDPVLSLPWGQGQNKIGRAHV